MKKPLKPPEIEDVWENRKLFDEYRAFNAKASKNTDEAKEIHQLIRRFNEVEYIHWDDLRRKKIEYNPILLWHLLERNRRSKFRKLQIGDEQFLFNSPEKFQKQLHLIDKASPASFDTLFGESPSEANKKQYLVNSVMEEAIASSQLEGAATTRAQAKKILREGSKPKNISEQMIVNNYRTIRRLKEIRDEPLSRELIVEIHREITHGTLESESDETGFRSCDVVVGSRVDPTQVYHYAPDCAKLPAMIDDLIAFANKDDEFIHPIVKAIILHFLIGYIHPFVDGNGRTARALFYWFALKHHYDLLEYISISRIFVLAPSQYTRAYQLTETDSNDMTYFIDFNIHIINRALEDLRKYLIGRKEEEAQSLQLVEELPDLSFRQAEILRDFIRNPNRRYTSMEIAGKYKVSLPTARTDLLLLEQKGKLKKYLDGNRQVFMYRKQVNG
jgi:Fic family protein